MFGQQSPGKTQCRLTFTRSALSEPVELATTESTSLNKIHYRERQLGIISRTFQLPKNVQADNLEGILASVDADRELHIYIPKHPSEGDNEETRSYRKVPITSV